MRKIIAKPTIAERTKLEEYSDNELNIDNVPGSFTSVS
jgi:hypothetical protein